MSWINVENYGIWYRTRTEIRWTARVVNEVQWGLVLRQFVLRRFTFTTLVESDRALPSCGASLSQLKRPFST